MTDTTASQQLHALRLEMIELKGELEMRCTRERSFTVSVAMFTFAAAVFFAVLISVPSERQRQARCAASQAQCANMSAPTYNCVAS